MLRATVRFSRRTSTLASVVGRWSTHPLRTIGCLAGALALTGGLYWAQPPRYEARTDVVVAAIPAFTTQKTVADMSIDSAVRLLTSDQVLGETARELNYPGGPTGLVSDLTISPVTNSRILQLYVRNEDPQLALDAVERLTDGLLTARTDRLEREAETRRSEIAARLAAIDDELESISSGDGATTLGKPDVARLVEEQTALEGERVGISTLPTESGFLSRFPQVSSSPKRPYAPVYIGSGLAIGLCASWLIAPPHRKQSAKRHLRGAS